MKLFNTGLVSVAALTLMTAALAQHEEVAPAATEHQAEQTQGEGAEIAPVAADDAAEQFKLLDANEDGRLSAEEAARNEAIVAGVFGTLDADQDAHLSLEEFRKIQAEAAE